MILPQKVLLAKANFTLLNEGKGFKTTKSRPNIEQEGTTNWTSMWPISFVRFQHPDWELR